MKIKLIFILMVLILIGCVEDATITPTQEALYLCPGTPDIAFEVLNDNPCLEGAMRTEGVGGIEQWKPERHTIISIPETILSQDVALSYKLLRYINSAEFTLRREIDSLKDAVVLLGIKNVKNWVSLLLMSKALGNKPNELIVTAMVRAKMCELLAEKFNPKIKSQMFIIGLFSILDVLMDTPMIELLDTIILSGSIKLALLDRYGEPGEIYNQVLLYENNEWDELSKTGVEAAEFSHAYIEAVLWADSTIKAL